MDRKTSIEVLEFISQRLMVLEAETRAFMRSKGMTQAETSFIAIPIIWENGAETGICQTNLMHPLLRGHCLGVMRATIDELQAMYDKHGDEFIDTDVVAQRRSDA